MKYISLFSGIEAASVAWHGPLGWEPICFSEIEPFPRAVLSHHYPDVKLHGDMTKVDWSQYRGQADAVIAGAPCQAFSVAGLRKSLDDDRGNLTLATLEAIDAIRPRFFVFENVPGILNTTDNAFGCFLGGLVGTDAPLLPPGKRGRWTNAGLVSGPNRKVCWRILDAQYWGVAQRRRRVFVVGCPRNGADPAEVLFEQDRLLWDPPSRQEAGEGVTHDVAGSLGASGRGVSRTGETRGLDPVIAETVRSHPRPRSNTVGNLTISPPVRSNPYGDHVSREGLMVPEKSTSVCGEGCALSNGTQLIPETSHSLTGEGHDASEDGTGPHVAYTLHGADKTVSTATETDIAGAVRTKPPGSIENSSTTIAQSGLCVRRLLPTETEKLQGFPRNWTQIPWRKKPPEDCPDGPRYRAIGNSMATPVILWIGKRIDQLDLSPPMT